MTRKPSYRFAGYIEPWEEKKLGEIVERITRKNKNLESDLPLTISAQYGLIDQETFFNKKVASKDVSGYYLLKKGEFAYNKSYSSDYPWGAVKRLDNYEMGVLSTLYIVFRPNSIDSDFLAVYYDSPKWYKEVSMRAAEGARNHGLLNISPQDFFDTELIFPVNQSEQIAIGSFFQDIDKLISLQQRKLEVLKEQKKTYLKLLFPVKGQTKPALRFAGFEDEWKEVKLGEVFEFSKGKGLPMDSFYEGEDNLAIGYGHLYTLYDEVITKVQRSSDSECSMYSNGNELLFPASSTVPFGTAKVVALLESGVKLGGDIIVASPDSKKVNNIFMSYNINSIKEKMYPITVGTTITHMYAKDLKELRYFLPNLPEQEAIASFFQDIDKAIAKQEEKVNQLKESKQTLLRKMFI